MANFRLSLKKALFRLSPEKLQRKLISHRDFLHKLPGGRAIILRQFQFSDMSKEGFNFSHAAFVDCFFIDCNFSNCVMRDVRFSDSHIKNTKFQGVDLTHANFAGTLFDNCDIRGAKFTTELLQASELRNIVCDDDQLPWLFLHPKFRRADPVRVAIARRAAELVQKRRTEQAKVMPFVPLPEWSQ
jgi:uncharacterized protein YjbI with pentapeptide repeats